MPGNFFELLDENRLLVGNLKALREALRAANAKATHHEVQHESAAQQLAITEAALARQASLSLYAYRPPSLPTTPGAEGQSEDVRARCEHAIAK